MTDGVKINIYNSGLVVWTLGGDFTVSCPMDVTFFPFDNQSCSIVVSSNSLPERMVAFQSQVNILLPQRLDMKRIHVDITNVILFK